MYRSLPHAAPQLVLMGRRWKTKNEKTCEKIKRKPIETIEGNEKTLEKRNEVRIKKSTSEDISGINIGDESKRRNK